MPVNNIFSGKDQQEATVRLEMIFTGVYEYLPTKIRQDENQMVVYSGSRVFASPYFTEEQKTTFSLASHHIEKVSEDESLVIDGNNVAFGPHKCQSLRKRQRYCWYQFFRGKSVGKRRWSSP